MNDPNRPEDNSRGAQSSETGSAGSSGAGSGSGGASSPGQAAGAAPGTGEGQRSTETAGSAAGSATTAGEAGQASSSQGAAASSPSSSSAAAPADSGSSSSRSDDTTKGSTDSSGSSSDDATKGSGSGSDSSQGDEDSDGSGGSGDGGASRPPEPRSRFTLWFAILLLAGGTGGAGWLTYDTQQELRQARGQFERLDEINAEVEQALGRVEEFEAEAEAAQAQGGDDELQELRDRLDEAESRSESTASTVAELEEQIGSSSDGERLSELRSRLESATEDLSALQERVGELADQQEEDTGGVDEAQLQELQEQLGGQVDELAARQEETRSRLKELGSRDPADEQSWVKAEAGYLARIAIDRVRHHHDVDSALAALRDADELLAQLDGQGVDERKAVGEAIDALLDYSAPETGELRQRIVAQIEEIDQLPIGARPDAEDAPQLPELQTEGEGDDGWQKAVSRAWGRLQQGLGDLVRIQREDGAEQFLPPDQRYFIRENLRLQLEGALLALSRGDAEAYRSGVERAAAWVEDHFDSEDTAVAETVEELNALAEEPITHDPPEIASTLEPVKPF